MHQIMCLDSIHYKYPIYQSERATDEDFQEWFAGDRNTYAVVTGRISGVNH